MWQSIGGFWEPLLTMSFSLPSLLSFYLYLPCCWQRAMSWLQLHGAYGAGGLGARKILGTQPYTPSFQASTKERKISLTSKRHYGFNI